MGVIVLTCFFWSASASRLLLSESFGCFDVSALAGVRLARALKPPKGGCASLYIQRRFQCDFFLKLIEILFSVWKSCSKIENIDNLFSYYIDNI